MEIGQREDQVKSKTSEASTLQVSGPPGWGGGMFIVHSSAGQSGADQNYTGAGRTDQWSLASSLPLLLCAPSYGTHHR